MVFCASAHGSSHTQTLLYLYSSHSNLCDLRQVQAQVEGHWPDLLLVTSSPALCSAGDKITRGNCSLSLVLYYRCFWPFPVTCIISLIQGGDRTAPTRLRRMTLRFDGARFYLRKLPAGSKTSVLRRMCLST